MIPRPRLRAVSRTNESYGFVAPAPDLTGNPGIRTAECIDAEQRKRSGKTQVILTFKTDAGELGRLWCEVPTRLTQTCRYMKLVCLALGNTPKEGTPIHPGTVF